MDSSLESLCERMVAIPSVSHNEAELADFVEAHLAGFDNLNLFRIGNNVVAKCDSNNRRRIVIAGHLDTVPSNGNDKPIVSNGRIIGLGSADMKSGLAVMLGLAGIANSFNVATTFVFYSCEEVSSQFSGLKEIEKYSSELLEGDAAVLMEPTSCRIEGGCQGTMRVKVTLRGKRAHTARPWTGINAIHRLGKVISRVVEAELRQPEINGLVYRESLQIVYVEGGVANNVVPDGASVVINYRFAPDRSLEEAYSSLKGLLGDAIASDDGDEIELIEGVPGALPALDDEFISTLMHSSDLEAYAKLGWTDVAFFASRQIPATNFGPGDPLLAHTREEHVEISEIYSAFNIMRKALTA